MWVASRDLVERLSLPQAGRGRPAPQRGDRVPVSSAPAGHADSPMGRGIGFGVLCAAPYAEEQPRPKTAALSSLKAHFCWDAFHKPLAVVRQRGRSQLLSHWSSPPHCYLVLSQPSLTATCSLATYPERRNSWGSGPAFCSVSVPHLAQQGPDFLLGEKYDP